MRTINPNKMAVMDDSEQIVKWREMVGQHVEQRREVTYRSRRKAAMASEVSESMWRQIESGARQLAPGVEAVVNPTSSTKTAICQALGWSPDSIDRLLRGEQPEELRSHPRGNSAARTVDASGLQPEQVALLEAMAAELRKANQ